MPPVVRPVDVWPAGFACFIGAVVGLGTCVYTGIVAVITEAIARNANAPWLPAVVVLTTAIGVPALVIAWCYKHLAVVRGVLLFGVGLSLGFAVLPTAIVPFLAGWFMPTPVARVTPVLALATGPALTIAAWGMCRLIRGPVVVQDGLTCPACRYNLRGNTTGICPECGHAYTLEELRVP